MIVIAHRGNTDGPHPPSENQPDYVDRALEAGLQAEVDVWYLSESGWWLGHDQPQYQVDIDWLGCRSSRLWVHAKNLPAMTRMLHENSHGKTFNYFWHEQDTVTLTSRGFIWAYPGNQPIHDSIAVMPEINNDDTSQARGVCTDYPRRYM